VSATSLRPPLMREAIVAEIANAGGVPHEDLVSLWTWHDGQALDRLRLMFAQRFYFWPLSRAVIKYRQNLELWEIIREDAPDAYSESWFPIIADHDKFQILVDCETGEVRGYGHEIGATDPIRSLTHLIDLWSAALRANGWAFPAPDGGSRYAPNTDALRLVAEAGTAEWDFLA